MRHVFAALTCVLVLSVSAPTARPAQPPPQRPQFRTNVEMVEVDVSVLDAKRRPVRGLSAGDFVISEDGTPQEILSFSAIDVPPAEPTRSGWTRDVAPDVRTNLAGADRLLVMVLDDAQVRWTPWHTKTVKAMATSVVDRLGRHDLLAIVFTRDNRGAQPFTNERARLLAAIETFRGDFGSGDPDYFYMNSLKTLRYVVQSLEDAVQRRKAVIYLSPGVPLEGPSLEAFERRREANLIFEDAGRANVNIYSLDPSGLGGLDGEDTVASAGRTQALANDFLFAAASNTGGRALVNRNDVVNGVGEVFAENASYYLIGYRSTNSSTSNKFRRINVRVNWPGVIVRARSGYRGAVEPSNTGGDGPSAALVKAMRDASPRGDVAMQMTAAAFAVPGKGTPSVAIAIAVRQPRVSGTDRVAEMVDLVVGAYEPDGTRRGSERLNARVTLRPSSDAYAHYEVLTAMPLRPGRYQLRVAAASLLQGREGSLHYDVNVPDFSRDDVNMSGVALSVEPNVPSAGRERIAAIVPVVPTSRREFWNHDRVSAFVRIHKNARGDEPVTLVTRVRDADERTVFTHREALTADRFAKQRITDHQIALPIDTLPPGSHLLTIEASLRRTSVSREVRMTKR
jgi:VWFA-related protein